MAGQTNATAPRSGARPARRTELLPYAFVTPIALLLVAVSFYPSLYAVWLGMTDATLLRLSRAKFIGLDNVVRAFADPIFLNGLWRTVRWDIAVVASEVLLALPIALFLNLGFRGRGVVRAAVVVPYIVPPAVTALIFVYVVDGNFGVLNDILVTAGVIAQPVSWLSEPTSSFVATVAAMVWAGTPLMVVILLAALQTIPKELYEAATVDGAGTWGQFRHITMPHLVPTIVFLVLLRTIWMSNHIDMIFIMTRGGPGFSNYTEAVYSFMLTSQFQIGYSSAVAVLLAIVLMTASAFYVRHLARSVLS